MPARTAYTEIDPKDWFDGAQVRSAMYTDERLFAAEMERIFESNWVYLAHESEVAQGGDYKTAWLGREPVVVVRAPDGHIKVFRNRCRHRGTTVCQTERGTTRFFRCAYHGWIYDLSGRLVSLTEASGYDGVASPDTLGLLPVARVETYRGLIFASLLPDVAPLKSHLGGALRFMDRFLDQGGRWALAVAGEFKLTVRANWKLVLENSTDGYHFRYTHRSFLDTLPGEPGTWKRVASGTARRFTRALPNGHSVIHGDFETVASHDMPRVTPAEWPEFVATVKARYPLEADEIIRASSGSLMNVCLFPNISLSDMFLRELRPIGPELTEVRHIALKLVDGPAEANQIRLRIHEAFNGPAGLGNTDDCEAWSRIQVGLRAAPETWTLLNRGLARESVENGNEVVADGSDESGMRGVYREWSRLMRGARGA
ncbi:MAG TPA: aromatic ring-hydroxylating dioxygenase subunit alpha [Burkholderiaceae bacterium]|nr:aromatic ring-hydroxylating dioxygenase subunit alpha [Burkholderiaceae bacterium]